MRGTEMHEVEDSHVVMEAEVRMTHLQAKECQGFRANPGSQQEASSHNSPRFPEGP